MQSRMYVRMLCDTRNFHLFVLLQFEKHLAELQKRLTLPTFCPSAQTYAKPSYLVLVPDLSLSGCRAAFASEVEDGLFSSLCALLSFCVCLIMKWQPFTPSFRLRTTSLWRARLLPKSTRRYAPEIAT